MALRRQDKRAGQHWRIIRLGVNLFARTGKPGTRGREGFSASWRTSISVLFPRSGGSGWNSPMVLRPKTIRRKGRERIQQVKK